MAGNGTQLQDEDSLSFLSSAFGALGQTVNQANPNVLLLGLILAGISKSLPSLKTWKKKGTKAEDVALLALSVLTFVLVGWLTNGKFSDPLPPIVYAPLLLGMLLKTSMSFFPKKERKIVFKVEWREHPEDICAFLVALVSLAIDVALVLGIWPAGSQIAVSLTAFLSFLLKALLPSKST